MGSGDRMKKPSGPDQLELLLNFVDKSLDIQIALLDLLIGGYDPSMGELVSLRIEVMADKEKIAKFREAVRNVSKNRIVRSV